MTTTPLIRLQPGQPDEGLEYNPRKPLPYPIFVNEHNACDNVPGYGLRHHPGETPRLLCFQTTPRPSGTSSFVDVDEWRSGDLAQAVGMYPVFIDSQGDMSSLTVPITDVETAKAVSA